MIRRRASVDPPVRRFELGVICGMARDGDLVWRRSDGTVVACEEKLKVLDQNLSEIRQICQDAFEDALLMGCDEDQIRRVFAGVVAGLYNPYAGR